MDEQDVTGLPVDSMERLLPELIGAEQRDERAATDTGQYYCVSAKYGTLVSRLDRPAYATLAEWQSLAASLPGAVYVPAFGTGPRGNYGPLFGSLPLLDTGTAPDVVGRIVELTVFLEKGAAMLAERVGAIDQQLAGRVHERELLARAAEMIDPDSNVPANYPTYEQRLDWLAKWREVVAR